MKPSSITGGSAQESSQSSNRRGGGAGKGKGQSSDSDDDFDEGKKSSRNISPEKNEAAGQVTEPKESAPYSIQTSGPADGEDAEMEESKEEEPLPSSTPLMIGQNSVQVARLSEEIENKEAGGAFGGDLDMEDDGDLQ